jgi:hypothetical protein
LLLVQRDEVLEQGAAFEPPYSSILVLAFLMPAPPALRQTPSTGKVARSSFLHKRLDITPLSFLLKAEESSAIVRPKLIPIIA